MFRSMELILILLALISSLDAAKVPLTQQQLKEKYGQSIIICVLIENRR